MAPQDLASAEATRTSTLSPNDLLDLFRAVRRRSLELTEPLSAEDQCIQSMPDVSPTKWHLAHTTWFFETFILKPNMPGYVEFHPRYNFLFNSYYEAVGPRHARPHRGLLSRPPLSDIHAYRAHVEDALEAFVQTVAGQTPAIQELLELGCHHEQQHQELMMTDIKHVLSCNPLKPAYQAPRPRDASRTRTLSWMTHPGGLVEIGHGGEGFAFDCEGPRHKVWVEPFKLASRPVTNGEFMAFIEAGGYEKPEFWLSDGWAACRERGWDAPLYWERADDGSWQIFTLSGLRPVDPDAPACHVSFFEADAYARFAGKRLPTEAEWEVVAGALTPAGNFAGSREYHPVPARGEGLRQLYGDVWEWTASAYRPYRGFQTADGAVGEYNGKFMSGQMVLRGGSCVTPEGHVRPTYRNFFYPPDRWQFSGLRLADDWDGAGAETPPVVDTETADEPPMDPTKLAFLNEVVVGLSDNPKGLSPKWFYDDVGAGIFTEICEVPEYYPTRTEVAILETHAADIAGHLGERVTLVEFGCGSMAKIRILLSQLKDPAAFVAIDISGVQLETAGAMLREEHPGIDLHTLTQDFTKPVQLPDGMRSEGRCCAFFPGSTIGNFAPTEARRLMARMRDAVGKGGALLIGVDLKKDKARLEAAYDDAGGVTARFNKNVLARINRDLGGDVDLDAFEHWAPFNDQESRIEMHLRSTRAQTITIAGHQFHFEKGETIHTENSYKYDQDTFRDMAESVGFQQAAVWTDHENLFAVFLFDAV